MISDRALRHFAGRSSLYAGLQSLFAGRGGTGGGPGSGGIFFDYAWRPRLDSGSVVLDKGAGAASFTRATTATLPWDYEGKPQNVLTNEVRFPGMRRVRNAVAGNSEDLTNASWVRNAGGAGIAPTVTANFALAPNGTMTASRVQYLNGPTNPDFSRMQNFCGGIGNIVGGRSSVWLKTNDGSAKSLRLRSASASSDEIVVAVTGAWQRFAGPITVNAAANASVEIYTDGALNGGAQPDILVWGVQWEDMRGASNQNPSEYVSVGAAKLNELVQTDDLAHVAWLLINTPLTAPAAVPGFFILTDDNAVSAEGKQQPGPAPGTDTWLGYVEVLKDADQSRFPLIHIAESGGASARWRMMLNTATGAVINYGGSPASIFGVVDNGISWRCYVGGPGTGGSTMRLELYPAGATVWGTENPTATGSAAFGKGGLIRGSTLPAYFPVGNVYPYHGAMVDGVRYFNTTNGNTVAANVVAANDGEYIPRGGLGWARLPFNTAASTFTTPDSVAASVTGDIDIRVLCAPDAWASTLQDFVSKWDGVSNKCFVFQQSGTSALILVFTVDGVNAVTASSTIGLSGYPASTFHWIRVTRSASTGDVKFYTSEDGLTWTQLGATVATPPSAIFDGTRYLEVGGLQSSSRSMAGTIRRAQIFNAIDGAAPVVDFDPTRYITGTSFTSATGELWTINGGAAVRKWPRGYLPEEATTNLILQSENFTSGSWSSVGVPTIVPAAKRCGSIVLDLLGDAEVGANVRKYQIVPFTGDGLKAVSVFFAQGSSASLGVMLHDSVVVAARAHAIITWVLGVPSVNVLFGTLLGLDPQGDGVWRLRLAGSGVIAANTHTLAVFPAADAPGSLTLTGTTYFGGVQAENKTFCTSYVPTTTAAVTRNIDSPITYPAAGNASAAAGTMYCETVMLASYALAVVIASVNDGTTNNRATLHAAIVSGGTRNVVSSGGVLQADMAAGASTVGAIDKRAIVWEPNRANAVHDGILGAVDTVVTVPVNFTVIEVAGQSGSAGGGEIIQDIRLWTRAATDAELAALTRFVYLYPFFELDLLSARIQPTIGTGTVTTSNDANGTVVNAAGLIVPSPANTPRFDYDPITHVCRGLLVEDPRTNILTFSNLSAVWGVTDATLEAPIMAPDGTVSMLKLAENGLAAQHFTAQAVVKAASAIQYTLSAFMKAGERTFGRLRLDSSGSNGWTVDFNLATGVAGVPAGLGVGWGACTAGMENYGNGIWRCWITSTSDTLNTVRALSQTLLGAGLPNYMGTPGWGHYVWGMQMESGANMTSYIPTAGAVVTRAIDRNFMLGINTQPWFNQAQGTLLVEFMRTQLVNSANGRAVSFTDATANEKHDLLHNGAGGTTVAAATTLDGGVQQVNVNAGSPFVPNVPFRMVYGYAANDCAVSSDGSAVVPDVTATMPTVTQLEIGITNNMSAAPLNGWVRRIQYWPFKMTNDQLQIYSGAGYG